MLTEGDKFVIPGLKGSPDGQVIYDCADGEETVFAVAALIKITDADLKRPAIS